MVFSRKPRVSPRPEPDGALQRSRAEAEQEHHRAQQQALAADTAVDALTRTRLRNGFAPAIMAGIINNREGK